MEIHINEKRYGHRLGLKDIHLSFPSGETTLIIGTSGAGKSTLIKCLIQKTTYNGSSKGYRKENIAYIPQHPALNTDETVYHSIFWSCRFSDLGRSDDIVHRMAEEAVKKVGLGYVERSKIKNISGGQIQRVSIAKELVRGKDIIIADEIDTGLDCGVARSLVQMLRRITKEEGKTTIIISHNIANIELYDNLVVLAKDLNNVGRVAFFGKPSQAKKHFDVKDYVDILMKINPKEEGGLGMADNYIMKQYSAGYN